MLAKRSEVLELKREVAILKETVKDLQKDLNKPWVIEAMHNYDNEVTKRYKLAIDIMSNSGRSMNSFSGWGWNTISYEHKWKNHSCLVEKTTRASLTLFGSPTETYRVVVDDKEIFDNKAERLWAFSENVAYAKDFCKDAENKKAESKQKTTKRAAETKVVQPKTTPITQEKEHVKKSNSAGAKTTRQRGKRHS